MALNNCKCYYFVPLHFKGLSDHTGRRVDSDGLDLLFVACDDNVECVAMLVSWLADVLTQVVNDEQTLKLVC